MDHTYKVTEIVGSSPDGMDAAIRNGIARASKTLRNLDWFEVTDVRGAMNEGDIAWFQVTMKVGFRLDDGGGHRLSPARSPLLTPSQASGRAEPTPAASATNRSWSSSA